MTATADTLPDTTPRWRTLAIATVAAGVVMLPLTTQGVALWAYAFPLFGVGVTYALQYRAWFSRAWWATLVSITPLSVVALALNWPFSGHVLWNVLFLGHNAMQIRSRPWQWVLAVSLVHLVVLKAVFQTGRDLAGALLAAALAGALLAVLSRLPGSVRS